MKQLTILLLVFVLTACGSEPQITVRDQTFNREQLAQGQQIYAQYCAACHGANGEGQFPDAPMQPDATGRIGAPPHDDTGHTWHHGDELLIRYIREGGMAPPTQFYPMPGFGDALTDDEIMLVIAYIKTMWSDENRAIQAQITERERGG